MKATVGVIFLCLGLADAGSLRNLEGEENNLALQGDDNFNPDFGFDETEYVTALSEKLQPRELIADEKNNLAPHQFLHLHHMKSGGTSMEKLLQCAANRLRKKGESDEDIKYKVQTKTIHECNSYNYRQCLDATDGGKCMKQVNSSAFMSYCAPVSDLATFGWRHDTGFRRDGESDVEETAADKPVALTVLRHPVDRVWSMYRFRTKGCYKCMNLTDIYAAIDENRTDEIHEFRSCFMQLENHQLRNMITSLDSDDWMEQAKKNLEEFFTLVGLTEDLSTTHEMLGSVVPWMAKKYRGTTCALTHSNKTPKNNGCGPNRTHWNLPDHPDEATRKVIEEHNQLDLELYAYASQLFEYQKTALGFGESVSE